MTATTESPWTSESQGSFSKRSKQISLRKKIFRGAAALPAGVAALGFAALTAAPAQAAVPFHEIVGQGSHKCLDVRAEDGVGNRNARIQTWQCFGSPNQEWGIVFAGQYSGLDYFQFVSKTTGSLCMEVRDSSLSNGAQIDQFLCAPDPNQLWRLGPGTGGNSFTLISMKSGKCLDVSGNSTLNGAKVQQWDCNRTTAQSFTFA
jgi:hypothetical protein